MRIILAKEKHCDRYLDASTLEKMDRSCKKLLRERLENGYYDPYDTPKGELIDLDKIPESLIEDAKRKNLEFRRKNREYLEQKEFLDRVKDCLKSEIQIVGKRRKVTESYLLLEKRESEYELIELAEVEE